MTTLIQILLTIQFFYKLLLHEDFRNPYKKICNRTCKDIYLLANGPSLSSFLKKISQKKEEIDEYDFFCVNAVAVSGYFTMIKPKYYVLSDPAFFYDTVAYERVKASIDAICNKVTWKMYLFIPYRFKREPFVDRYKENHNIIVVPFHSRVFSGLPVMRNWIYSHGLGNGEFGTVILNAEYIAISLGYKHINLVGVEHTFFNGLCVNNDNVPCYVDTHFYDSTSVLQPIVWGHDDNRKYFSMALFLEEKMKIFQGHEIMQSYAQYMGAHIVNCTPGSLIDAYDRLS